MSDDKQNSPISKSVTNASLDDILSSLEQQLNTSSSSPAPVTSPIAAESDSLTPIEPASASLSPAPEAPELDPKLDDSVDIETSAHPPSFAMEEKIVDPISTFTPPSITPAPETLQEKPVLKAELHDDDQSGHDAVIEPSNFMGSGIVAAKKVMKEHTTPQPNDAPPAPPKKKGFGFNPSVAMGAVVALVLMVGSVAAFILQRQDQSLYQRATSEACNPGTGEITANNYRIDAEIQCTSTCGPTGGRICKLDGTFGGCITSTHACGSVPQSEECDSDEDCRNLGYGTDVTCNDSNDRCVGQENRYFIGCGSGGQLTNAMGCQNCYRYPSGSVTCVSESTSCGAKSSCQSNPAPTTPPPTYSCPAPASCVGPNTPNGLPGQNCGSWGMVDGGGSCSGGGFCCKTSTYVDRCDWNHSGAGTTCTGDGVNRQYNNGVPTRPACCGGLVEDGYGTCGCAPATPVPTPVPTPTPTPTPPPTPNPTPTATPGCPSQCLINTMTTCNSSSGVWCANINRCYPQAQASQVTCSNTASNATILSQVTSICTEACVPSPTVTPSPTPTGTPIAAVCMSITKDIQAPKLGDQVRFTCGTATNATRYEFRWKVDSAISGLNPISSGSNISVPLTITTAGVYKAQCRPCVGNSCTEWETF